MTNPNVVTADPGATDGPLTRAVLLSVIDKEIELRLNLEKRNGWSSWLFVGAACTVAWTFARELDLPNTDWRLLGTLTLLLSIVYDLLVLVWFGIQPRSGSRKGIARFVIPRLFAASMIPSVIVNSMRACLMLVLLATVLGTSSTIFLPALIHYSMVLLLQIALLLVLLLRIPLGEPKFRGLVQTSVNFVLPFLAGYPGLAALIASHSLLQATGAEIFEYHLHQSILCAALLVSLCKLAKVLPPPTLPERLLELRRNLAFGQMSVQEASRHAEFVLLGMSTRDLLEEDCASAHFLIAELRTNAIAMNDTLEAIITMAPEQPPPPGAQRLAFDALIQSFHQLQEKCESNGTRLEMEVKSLGKRVKMLQLMRVDQNALKAQLVALKASYEDVQEAVKSIRDVWNRWPGKKHVSAHDVDASSHKHDDHC